MTIIAAVLATPGNNEQAAGGYAVLESTAQAAALMDPVRLRILAHMREPDSAAGVARALGLPRQRIGYHIRELERAGLVRFVGERRRGNCLEHLLQATATHYVVGPRALGALGLDPHAVRDRFSSDYLIAAASQTIDDVGRLREQARAAGRPLPTLTLESEVRFASSAQQRAFAEELTETLARLVSKYHDEGSERGRRFRVVIAGYPKTREQRVESRE